MEIDNSWLVVRILRGSSRVLMQTPSPFLEVEDFCEVARLVICLEGVVDDE